MEPVLGSAVVAPRVGSGRLPGGVDTLTVTVSGYLSVRRMARLWGENVGDGLRGLTGGEVLFSGHACPPIPPVDIHSTSDYSSSTTKYTDSLFRSSIFTQHSAWRLGWKGFRSSSLRRWRFLDVPRTFLAEADSGHPPTPTPEHQQGAKWPSGSEE